MSYTFSTSGTYTPTLTGVANVAASTAYQCQWMRVGNIVTVSGQFDLDPTAATTLTQLGISLPVASNLSATNDLGGTATSASLLGYVGPVSGDSTNDRAQFDILIGAVITNQSWFFSFNYLVI